jgi:hypothetical protein
MEEKKEVKVGAIYKALWSIMGEVTAVSKDRVNQYQQYKFRGIDDIVNVLHPLFTKHKVLMVPQIMESSGEEKAATVDGKTKMSYIRKVTMEYCFVSVEDGSEVRVIAEGEGFDTSDKAKPKAITMAFKQVLQQMFMIPTEDSADAEQDHIEHPVQASAAKSAPKAEPGNGNGQGTPAAKPKTGDNPFRADVMKEIGTILDKKVDGKNVFTDEKRSEIRTEVKKARSMAALAAIKQTLEKEFALIEEESKKPKEVKDGAVA